MLINSPDLPNIDAIADTSRGKLSAHLDLNDSADAECLRSLSRDAHLFIESYRPGGLAERGFAPGQLAAIRPGIVCVSLSAYGHEGPWAGRRGFDSLVQTATGFNIAEAKAAGEATPRALPVQILDYASGFLMAFAGQVALLRQQEEGGSWHVQVSLAATAHWLRSLGRIDFRDKPASLGLRNHAVTTASGFGKLTAMPHAARIDGIEPGSERPSARPGTHAAAWPPTNVGPLS
jgi:crotonobetainyl-CoA:carnitine CoA-transferase CaiB-like acyl-CoA transferase